MIETTLAIAATLFVTFIGAAWFLNDDTNKRADFFDELENSFNEHYTKVKQHEDIVRCKLTSPITVEVIVREDPWIKANIDIVEFMDLDADQIVAVVKAKKAENESVQDEDS